MVFVNSLFKLCYHPLRTALKPCTWSLLKTRSYAYDAAGHTTAIILNKDKELGLFINTYSNGGFKLSNGVMVIGPIILFPRSVFAWKIGNHLDVDGDSLNIFKIVQPSVELLLVGLGTYEDSKISHQKMLSILKVTRRVEVLSTPRAIGIYNFMVAEGRNVAAALIPPAVINPSLDDMMTTSMKSNNIDKNKNWLKI